MDISVVVPFYKGNQYMERLFSSIRENAQNAKELQIELLIVNDSPDCPVQYSQDWINGFQVEVFNNPENVGIQGSRINGIRLARGAYIQMLDQDDVLASDTLASQYACIGNADLVLANGYNENKDASIPIYRTKAQQKMATSPRFYYTVSNQIVSPGQTLIRKNAIPQQWLESGIGRNGSDDLLLWLMLFYHNAVWAINNSCLYTHKDTGHNLSNDIERMVDSSKEVLAVLQHFGMVTKRQSRQFRSSRAMAEAYIGKSTAQKLLAILQHPVIAWNRLLLRLCTR